MADMAMQHKLRREMKVLALGLPRTGSASIADGLSILGYKNVHHGITAIDSVDDWKVIDRAADATFSILPSYTGQPFTRDEWDELYGCCEAGTDMAALFAVQLINIYPDAKVLLVIRDFDKWYASYNLIFQELWSFSADLAIKYAEPLIGSKTGSASRKAILGFFEARNVNEARGNARWIYDRHYRQLQEMVPSEKLLLYRMGEGWDPICDFLGKSVPMDDFPWVNEAAVLKEKISRRIRAHIVEAAMVLLPWVVGIIGIGVGLKIVARNSNFIG